MTMIDRRSLFALFAMAVGGALVLCWWPRRRPRSVTQPRPEPRARTIEKPVIREPVSPWREKQLRQAIMYAKQKGKPLLVLVAPATNDGDVRGKWFGTWIEDMPDEDVWLAASCVLACATVSELGYALGTKVEGAPLWVFADVGESGEEKGAARVTPIDCELPILPRRGADENMWAARTTGLQSMHAAFVAGAKGHGLELAPLAAAALRRLEETQQISLEDWFASGLGAELIAMALADAEVRRRLEAQRPQVKPSLLRYSVDRSFHEPVAGARWIQTTPIGGCGWIPWFVHPTESEKEEWRRRQEAVRAREGMGACGMGVAPAICWRFLEFWTAGN
jgi:hypothetical protein